MRTLFIALGLVVLLAGNALFANPTVFKPHKGKKGKDQARINCVYCHNKAKLPKQKAKDLAKLKKGQYCAGKDCH